jgi:hypothetical protein
MAATPQVAKERPRSGTGGPELSIRIPTRTPDGDLVEVEYFDAEEVAQQLGGIKPRTVQRHTTGTIGDWPHIKLRRSPYLSAEHLARVVELLTHDPDRIPDQADRPPRLGVACTTDQLEDIAEPPRGRR